MTDRERLDQLEILVSELLQKQDRTIEEVVQIKRDVAELSARISRLEDRMESVESRMGSLEERMGSLESRMERLEKRVDDLTAVVKMLSKQQATLTDKVLILQTTVEEGRRQMNNGLSEVLEAIRNK